MLVIISKPAYKWVTSNLIQFFRSLAVYIANGGQDAITINQSVLKSCSIYFIYPVYYCMFRILAARWTLLSNFVCRTTVIRAVVLSSSFCKEFSRMGDLATNSFIK